ncbi:MAG: Glutamate synthase [NADPH] large chain [uncultured Rubellimicrobium sp.]|uniref:Glutamate synthase [NADPH] large chain n=1 Tax=uncultured Rubellimicrobium sp. TaxID=543078 RepID=A0A6J4P957_9RHOB|nr:MAG: Glutamate synthase [NADPH] large chain [uncultured Rubellimicrobium sp.]
MNRTELIVATAVILFATFALGWFAGWLVNRFTRVTRAEIGELDRMAQALHEAEETRDQALAYLGTREAELENRAAQRDAELRAAMDGLRDARAEAEGLRNWIERNHRR